jgi:hypothetical protein
MRPFVTVPRALGETVASIAPTSVLGRDPDPMADALPGRALPDDQIRTLLFVHLPRTAGTTLNNILERQYGETAFVRLKSGLAVQGSVCVEQRIRDKLTLERGRFRLARRCLAVLSSWRS